MTLDVDPKPRHPAQDTFDARRLARQDAFLTAYPRIGNIRKTAESVGISPELVYGYWNKDPDFQQRFRLAKELWADFLEDLALQKVERLDSRDNVLHMMLLNGARPEKYRPELKQQPVQDNRQTTVIINYPQGYQPQDKQYLAQNQPQGTDSGIIEASNSRIPLVASDADTVAETEP